MAAATRELATARRASTGPNSPRLTAARARPARRSGKAFERLTQELAQFEFAVSRLDHVARRCAEEAAHYRALHASIDERVVAATAEVQQLHAGLEAALLRRAQRQRYEEVAATVNQRPSRDVLEA